MIEKAKPMTKKIIFLVCSLIVFVSTALFVTAEKRKFCMGVPRITKEELNSYTETTELDISQITFEGEPVAIDWGNNSIYVSQSIENKGKASDFQGKLEAMDSNYQLFFLDDLLIIRSGALYQKVNVVITTLPVMYLKIEGNYADDEGNNVIQGRMTLWNSFAQGGTGYQTKTSSAQWHMRGNSTRIYPKMSWKLNLKESDGQNRNEDLLGLGSDDDWILNPMSMDDTFVKEKLSQILWNQVAETVDYNDSMSEGQYIELVINGSYQGLYLLQRRVDAKFLKLDQTKDILLKGINTWEAETVADGYEIVWTPYDVNETYQAMEQVLKFQDGNGIHMKNFIDVSLFLQFLSGCDNYGYKNMFYALRKTGNAYEMSMVPWDTDLSLGVTWGYDYEQSVHEMIERQELDTLRKQVPDIDEKMAVRWHQLRKSIYSEENIFAIYEEVTEELLNSGALQRDFECWGLLHEGEDNWGNLQRFIKERLEILDEYYDTEKKSVN